MNAREAQALAMASATQWQGDVLRVLTCGSVDAGKSTLIGRLLFDLGLVADDQLVALERDTRRTGFSSDGLDYSLLLDGLEAEQQQGITIDVAYRYIRTETRKLIIADSPGHEQYTRNMACGASGSDVAIVLVDAEKGILTQTRRHTRIANLFGVKHVILVVNKIDAVAFDEDRFDAIAKEFAAFAAELSFASVVAIPVAAREGVNIVHRSPNASWFGGPTLLEAINRIDTPAEKAQRGLRVLVQSIHRTPDGGRAIAARVVSGRLRQGDEILFGPSAVKSTVTKLLAPDGDRSAASAGDSLMITVADDVDVTRGDVVYSAGDRPESADQFSGTVLWMSESPLVAGRSYLMKIGTRTIPASVTRIRHQIDVNTGAKLAHTTLAMNEIARCNLSVSAPIEVDSFEAHPETGSFILIDRSTNETAGAGTIVFPLRRASNLHHQNFRIDKQRRMARNAHRPAVLWLTGLPGAGKSTIGNLVEQKLHAQGCQTYLIDGDNIREGLNRDLGFTYEDRVENIRRAAEVAALFVDAGTIVIVALISPFRSDRQQARERVGANEFFEVFIDTPLEICRARDPKGLYAKAVRGELANMTGVQQPYEAPQAPELRLPTPEAEPDQLADRVVTLLRERGVIA